VVPFIPIYSKGINKIIIFTMKPRQITLKAVSGETLDTLVIKPDEFKYSFYMIKKNLEDKGIKNYKVIHGLQLVLSDIALYRYDIDYDYDMTEENKDYEDENFIFYNLVLIYCDFECVEKLITYPELIETEFSRFRENSEVIKLVALKNIEILEYIDDSLLDDEEFCKYIIEFCDFTAYYYISERLSGDPVYVAELIKLNFLVFNCLNDDMKDNEILFNLSIKIDALYCSFFSERLRRNKKVIINLMKENPMLSFDILQNVPEPLKNDREIIDLCHR
jgi:hypothetical protein